MQINAVSVYHKLQKSVQKLDFHKTILWYNKAFINMKGIDHMADLTKNALAASVSELLKIRPIDKITVKEITDRCGVTRNTFYYHFHDIYDLCSWIFIRQTEEILNTYRGEDSWKEGFSAGLNYLYENKNMIYHVYRSVSKTELDRYLYRVTEKYALGLVEAKAADMTISEKTKKVAADFYKNAFVGSIWQWIEEDMETEPETLAVLCDSIFRGTVREALESIEKVLGH